MVSDFTQGREVGDHSRRVGDHFAVDRLGLGSDRGGERVGVVTGNERRVDTEPPQRDVEQRARASVQLR